MDIVIDSCNYRISSTSNNLTGQADHLSYLQVRKLRPREVQWFAQGQKDS